MMSVTLFLNVCTSLGDLKSKSLVHLAHIRTNNLKWNYCQYLNLTAIPEVVM